MIKTFFSSLLHSFDRISFTAATTRMSRSLSDATTRQEVEEALRSGQSADEIVRRGGAVLKRAIERGNKEVIACLLENGAPVDACDNLNRTPLMHVCHEDLPNLVDDLKPFASTESEREAHDQRRTEIVRILLSHGADVNATNWSDTNALILACQKGFVGVATVLLEHGANPNSSDWTGRCALSFACESEDFGVIELLLRHGADPNLASKDKNTMLMIACRKERVDLVDLVVQHSADTGDLSSSQVSPIMAVSNNWNVDIIDRLLQMGASVNVADRKGVTILMKACKDGVLSVVDRLIICGADFREVDREGASALIYAIRESQLEVAERLISVGAPVDFDLDSRYPSPLKWACWRNQPHLVKLLLEAGAQIYDLQRILRETDNQEIIQILKGVSILSLLLCCRLLKLTQRLFCPRSRRGTPTNLTFFSLSCDPSFLFSSLSSLPTRQKPITDHKTFSSRSRSHSNFFLPPPVI